MTHITYEGICSFVAPLQKIDSGLYEETTSIIEQYKDTDVQDTMYERMQQNIQNLYNSIIASDKKHKQDTLQKNLAHLKKLQKEQDQDIELDLSSL